MQCHHYAQSEAGGCDERKGTRACLRNLGPNLLELKRRPEESCERLKAKQSDIADKVKEPCQSGPFLFPDN
jgi:hypothetical protein